MKSFEEFVRFRSEEEYQRFAKLDFQNVSAPLIGMYNKDYLEDYLLYGGYPKAALIKNKTERIEEFKPLVNLY